MDAGDAYRLHAPAVLGYLRSQGVPDADDVLSEAFLQVARSLPRFKGDDEHLRAWIFTIARNRAIDGHRRRSRRPVIADGPMPDTAAPARDAPADPDLVRALALLTDEQREVIALRFVADLPLEDVAAITGRNAGAVKSMQHRALAQLARILEGAAGAEQGDD